MGASLFPSGADCISAVTVIKHEHLFANYMVSMSFADAFMGVLLRPRQAQAMSFDSHVLHKHEHLLGDFMVVSFCGVCSGIMILQCQARTMSFDSNVII